MRAATGAGRSSAVMIAVIAPLLYVIMFLWQPEHVQLLLDDLLELSRLQSDEIHAEDESVNIAMLLNDIIILSVATQTSSNLRKCWIEHL